MIGLQIPCPLKIPEKKITQQKLDLRVLQHLKHNLEKVSNKNSLSSFVGWLMSHLYPGVINALTYKITTRYKSLINLLLCCIVLSNIWKKQPWWWILNSQGLLESGYRYKCLYPLMMICIGLDFKPYFSSWASRGHLK